MSQGVVSTVFRQKGTGYRDSRETLYRQARKCSHAAGALQPVGKTREYFSESLAMNIVRYVLVRSIRAYQYLLSPFLGQHCRFHPSCSSYAIEALETHGLLKGTLLSVRRVSKCHPFHPGGVDPVPPNKTGMVH